MTLQKNNYYEIKITDIGIDGEGIGKINYIDNKKINSFTVFVQNALPEEVVKIKLIKIKKNYGYGKLIEILTPSPFRVKPICQHFKNCGGCSLQHIEYKNQLKVKSNIVKNNIERIGKISNVNIPLTLGMENPYNYRNKVQLPVNNENNTINIGFFTPKSHNIVNVENCIIQDPVNEKIIKKIREFIIQNNIKPYDEKNHTGLIRHIVTRIGKNTKQIIICIVINSNNFKYEKELIEKLKDLPNLSGIVLNFNTKKTNVILGDKIKTIFGNNYITDTLLDLKFKISILSFYQVNPIQTEVLYKKVLDFAGLTGKETVIDAYCGIGTISLFLARKAKKVYGIEIIEEAIKDANFNAQQNNIKNVEFLVGKSEEIVPYLINKRKITPDILVLDPPRKGCDQKLLDSILLSKPKKIVYVSCNPSTLARDINFICKDSYSLEKIQPVDMFCHSTHVECVVLISRLDK